MDFNGGDHLAMPDMVVMGYILQLRLAALHQDQAAIQVCLHQAHTRSSQSMVVTSTRTNYTSLCATSKPAFCIS